MANVNKAYEVLSDPAQREEHDRWIERKLNGAQALHPLSRPHRCPTCPRARSTRWPWYLLLFTISFAVVAIGTVV